MGIRAVANDDCEAAIANFKKAIELDPSVAEAHAALATVKIKHDHDPVGAEVSFRKAIAAGPNCSMAYSRYTYFLAAMGRLNEALEKIRHAQEIDPLSPDANASLAMILYFLGDYDEAMRYCRIALALEPAFAEAALILGRCFEQKESFKDAAAHYSAAKKMDPDSTEPEELLSHLYAVTGRTKMARESLFDLSSPERKGIVRPFNIAAIHTALGENELAGEWLQKPFVNWTERMRMIRFDPRLDNLREDPSFSLDYDLDSSLTLNPRREIPKAFSISNRAL